MENEKNFYHFFVNITVDDTEKLFLESDLGISFSIKGESKIEFSPEKKCIVIVVEKYFYRVNNYVTGTIIIDNIENKTKIQIITTGGGNGLLGIEWWSEENFKKQIQRVFEKYTEN